MDSQDRVWLTTDSSGEIWVLEEIDGDPGSPSSPSDPNSTTGDGESPDPSDEGAGLNMKVDAASVLLAAVLWMCVGF